MASCDPSNPTWIVIKAAVARGGRVANANGYAWSGQSCRVVSTIALWCVMWTRNYDDQTATRWPLDNEGPLRDQPEPFALAYADHYLNQRAFTGLGKPVIVANIKGAGYEAGKRGINDLKNARTPEEIRRIRVPSDSLYERMGRGLAEALAPATRSLGRYLERSMQENKCRPLSNPGPEEKAWRERGAVDGVADHDNNPDLDVVPVWLPMLERRAQLALIERCR